MAVSRWSLVNRSSSVASLFLIAVLVAIPVAAADQQSTPPGSTVSVIPSDHTPGLAPLQQAVTIVESASGGHDMDTIWASVATGMGHTPTIVPQTTLDDTGFFGTTDILIVSSGVLDLPSNRVTTITQFVQQGGAVYIQGEYICTWTVNVGFAAIVAALGGSHTWSDTISGDLQPMNVLGVFATTPNNVPTIGYFWYGCYGTGDATITPFLEYDGNYYGFAFKSTDPGYGVVIITTDQDWVRTSTRLPLMENILNSLETGTVPVELQKISIE